MTPRPFAEAVAQALTDTRCRQMVRAVYDAGFVEQRDDETTFEWEARSDQLEAAMMKAEVLAVIESAALAAPPSPLRAEDKRVDCAWAYLEPTVWQTCEHKVCFDKLCVSTFKFCPYCGRPLTVSEARA